MSTGSAMPGRGSSAVMLAVDRVMLSRRRLQQALMPAAHASGSRASSARPALLRWLDRLASTPATGILVGTLQSWWARHPMRLPLLLIADAAQTLIGPVAKKQPYMLVLGAAATGALLVLSRPWRWLPRALLTPALLTPARLASLLPTLVKQAAAPAAHSA
jgi:hypothetical protein